MAKMITCFRCRGLKKIFKIGSAYSLNDCGGQKVDCPLCLGVGEIEPLDKVVVSQVLHDEDMSQKISIDTKQTLYKKDLPAEFLARTQGIENQKITGKKK